MVVVVGIFWVVDFFVLVGGGFILYGCEWWWVYIGWWWVVVGSF